MSLLFIHDFTLIRLYNLLIEGAEGSKYINTVHVENRSGNVIKMCRVWQSSKVSKVYCMPLLPFSLRARHLTAYQSVKGPH
jgi:hypothetical protein